MMMFFSSSIRAASPACNCMSKRKKRLAHKGANNCSQGKTTWPTKEPAKNEELIPHGVSPLGPHGCYVGVPTAFTTMHYTSSSTLLQRCIRTSICHIWLNTLTMMQSQIHMPCHIWLNTLTTMPSPPYPIHGSTP